MYHMRKNVQGVLDDLPQVLVDDLDTLWVLWGAVMVFFMQCGFALLEVGTVQKKNTKNILLKNVLDACIGAFVWWSVGYAFAYGERGYMGKGFIGGKGFFAFPPTNTAHNGAILSHWIFSWTFAATSATIVSGAVAERCYFRAYLIYTTIMTGVIYPCVVHWMWSDDGWLSPSRADEPLMGGMGAIDFAGSGVVHITGGGAALVGAYIVGPRRGRFMDGQVKELRSASPALSTLGTFILWFGWYGFNTSSTGCMIGCMNAAAKIAVNTTISASASALTVLCASVVLGNPGDIAPVLNGILGGLVAVTAACSIVEPYAASLIGTIGGIIYFASSHCLKKLKIDDPLDASPVHFFCGIWGLLAVGIFATKSDVYSIYGGSNGYGLLYGSGFQQLGIQLLAVIAISSWTLLLNSMLFMFMNSQSCFKCGHDEMEDITDLGISKYRGSPIVTDVEMPSRQVGFA